MTHCLEIAHELHQRSRGGGFATGEEAKKAFFIKGGELDYTVMREQQKVKLEPPPEKKDFFRLADSMPADQDWMAQWYRGMWQNDLVSHSDHRMIIMSIHVCCVITVCAL